MADAFRSQSAAQITTRLTAFYVAMDAIAAGKSYTITSGGVTRTVSKENLREIVDTIEKLEESLAHKSGSSVKHTHVKVIK